MEIGDHLDEDHERERAAIDEDGEVMQIRIQLIQVE
jgi:hypothetical protein